MKTTFDRSQIERELDSMQPGEILVVTDRTGYERRVIRTLTAPEKWFIFDYSFFMCPKSLDTMLGIICDWSQSC